MSRAEDLAAAFERANAELIDCVRGLGARQWLTPGVNSPIVQVGDEAGSAARHASENPAPDQAETIRLLEERGAAVAATTRPT